MTKPLDSSNLFKEVARRIRVRKDQQAYVYNILESHEGVASYSTLDHKPGDGHRDLLLSIPVAFLSEVEELLTRLSREMREDTGEIIYDLDNAKEF